MQFCSRFAAVCLLALVVSVLPTPVAAQGLVWSLPEEEGVWVRYSGTYTNVQERPQSTEGPLEISRLSELKISALKRETIEVDGESVPARWLEFKLVSGTQSAEGIQPGPYGTRIYSVLVPESAITGKLVDDDGIPEQFLPILKGYRKIGDKPAEVLQERILKVYPLLTLLMDYKDFAQQGEEPEQLDLPQYGMVSARHFVGTETLETATTRSVNRGELWLSPDVPFGWAQSKVTVVREVKESTQPREEFRKAAEITVQMAVAEMGTGAQSEIGELPAE